MGNNNNKYNINKKYGIIICCSMDNKRVRELKIKILFEDEDLY